MEESPSFLRNQAELAPKLAAQAAYHERVENMRPLSERGNPPMNMDEVEGQIEKVRDKFEYDPETGLLYYRWITDERDRLATKRVGRSGYGRTAYWGMWTTSANIVWLIHKGRWPIGRLRRRNDNAADDRIENLFEVREEDTRERISRPARERVNKSLGVSRCGPDHWQAYTRKNGRQIGLGRFKTREAALAARKAWEVHDRGEDLV